MKQYNNSASSRHMDSYDGVSNPKSHSAHKADKHVEFPDFENRENTYEAGEAMINPDYENLQHMVFTEPQRVRKVKNHQVQRGIEYDYNRHHGNDADE